MNIMSYRKWFALIIMLAGIVLTRFALAGDPNTPFDRFTNIGSILNTRHNLTQNTAPLIAGVMNSVRNDYGEVCVYCHTPHSSQTLLNMPLWNRTVKATTYTTYNSFSLTQGTAPQPGNNSLTCLTCHDGQTAIDSIINMPGSGMGDGGQATTQSTAFLNSWPPGGGGATNHMGLDSTNGVMGNGLGSSFTVITSGAAPPGGILQGCGPVPYGLPVGTCLYLINPKGCLTCHSTTGDLGGGGPDFAMFFIGTDLTNDHPVGINYPAASGVGSGFNLPGGAKGAARYFDNNSNGHMDTDEVRTYDGRVECASCHDPHGVPTAGTGSVFKPTFLRVANGGATGSALCLTCHDK